MQLKTAHAVGVVQPRELPEEYHWPGTERRWMVCAFYTPNYLPQITSLITSLEQHGIGYFVKRVEHQGTWERTTQLKPTIVKACLDRFPDKDVLYLDADAVVRRMPDLLDDIEEDVGILLHPTEKPGKWYIRLSAGTIFVRNTAGGRRFAEQWVEARARAKPHYTDEDLLYIVLQNSDGLTLRLLPQSYYKVFDKANGVEPVIEHFQASRSQNNVKWSKRRQRNVRIAQIAGGVALVAAASWIVTQILR